MKKTISLILHQIQFICLLPLMPVMGIGGLSQLLNVGSILGGLTPKASSQRPFPDHLTITDGDDAYNTMAEVLALIGGLAAGSVFTKIWEQTVAAQQQRRWGFGSPQTPHNQGYMWFYSIDVTVDIQSGKLRLVQSNAMETKVYVVKELDDTRLHTATNTAAGIIPTNINEMVALPEKVEFPKVGEDSKLALWYRCIAVATAEDTVGFSIPVTIYQ